MSHRATNWLAGLPPDRIGPSEFRVLFHLCDCHNPAQGCFPTQAYLIQVTGSSNGTVNNALSALETKGLIKRHRTFDGKTKRQRPTRYILGFEIDGPQKPTPETGDGKRVKSDARRLQETGDGADSNLRGDPTPISGGSRLQPTGEVTCKEPVINRGRDGGEVSQTEKAAIFWAGKISEGKPVVPSAISASVARFMLDHKLLTSDQLRQAGIAS